MQEITIDNLWNNNIYQDSSYYTDVKRIATLITNASNNEYTEEELSVGNNYICVLDNKNNKMPSLAIVMFCENEPFNYINTVGHHYTGLHWNMCTNYFFNWHT